MAEARIAAMGNFRSEIDNATPFFLTHGRQNGAAAEECAAYINIEHAIPFLDRHFLHHAGAGNGSSVD